MPRGTCPTSSSVLGRTTAELFGVLRVGPVNKDPITTNLPKPVKITDKTVCELLESNSNDISEFADLGEGLGCLKDAKGNFVKVKIHRDENVHPRIQRGIRFPPKQQEQIAESINKLLELVII